MKFHKFIAATALFTMSCASASEAEGSPEINGAEVESSITTAYFVTVKQVPGADGNLGTVNTLISFDVGYRVVKQGDACKKITFVQTGTFLVPVKLKTRNGEYTINEEHPIIESHVAAVKCPSGR